ncbi:Bud site selection protein 6 [Coemansia sp. RSA 1646]|nr:Bud site selection protein 6 [Coemansia sp. RSA 1646]
MNRGFVDYRDSSSGVDGQSPEPADYTSPVYGGTTRPLGSAMTRAYGNNNSSYTSGGGGGSGATAGPISAMGSLRSTRSTAGNKPALGSLRRNQEYLSHNNSDGAAVSSPSSHFQPFVLDAGERRTPDYLMGGPQAGPQTSEYGYHRRMAGGGLGRPTSSRSTVQQPPPVVTSFADSEYYAPRSSSIRKYKIAGDYEDTRSTPPPPPFVPSDAYSRRTSSRVQAVTPTSPPPPQGGGATARPYTSQRVEFGYTSPAMAMMAASRSPERDDEIADIIADMSKTRIAALGDSDSNGVTTNDSGSSAEEVRARSKKRPPVRYVYLQLGDDTKKAAFDGSTPSHVELVNMFIDKYKERLAENPDTVPSIYIKDPECGVFYELEDMADVATGTVLQWRPKPLADGSATAQTKKEGELDESSGSSSPSAVERDIQALAEIVRALSDTMMQLPTQMKSEMDSALGAVRQHTDDTVSDAMTKTLSQITALLREGEAPRQRTREIRATGRDGADAMEVEPDANDDDDTGALTVVGSSKPSIARSASMPLASDAELTELRSKLRKAELGLSVARQEHQAALAAAQLERDTLASDMDKLRKDVGSHPNILRVRIEEGKAMLKTDYRALNTRFEDVDTLVQEMRKDVTQRGAIPTPQLVKNVEGELAAIKNGTKRLLAFINDTRSDWKRTWEEELQNILKEQGFVKDVEQLLGELDDDNSHLEGVVDKLDKVIDLKQQERAREGYVPPAATKFLDVVSPDDAPEAKKDFLMQISCVDIDHARRLDALEAAEKLRRKELAAKVNEFDEELSNFVGQRKLRKTGGTEELERRRAEKDIEVMKDMLKSVEEVELARREKIAQRKAAKKTQPQKKKKKPVSMGENDVGSETDAPAETKAPVAEDNEPQDVSGAS